MDLFRAIDQFNAMVALLSHTEAQEVEDMRQSVTSAEESSGTDVLNARIAGYRSGEVFAAALILTRDA